MRDVFGQRDRISDFLSARRNLLVLFLDIIVAIVKRVVSMLTGNSNRFNEVRSLTIVKISLIEQLENCKL